MKWRETGLKYFFSFVLDLFLCAVKYVNDRRTNHEIAA